MFRDFLVVELANVLAGPSAGMFFAELGATVIKVEHPSGGDVTRSWKLPSEDPSGDISAYFSSVNWGKKSIAVDFSRPEGLAIIHDLLAKADLAILSFKPGDAAKFSLDYESVRALNPRIIYAEISGYGPEDPRVGYDAILQAETGFMSMNGTPDSGPVKMPVALIDVLAAHQLKEGILLALLERSVSGRGKRVSVSLFDSALASLVNQAANFLVGAKVPERIGSEHPNIVPYGTVFRTRDGAEIVLAVGTDAQFARLAAILAVPGIARDAKFSTHGKRVEHREELNCILRERIREYGREELLEKLEAEKVPAGAVNRLDELFALPAARKMLIGDGLSGVSGIAFGIPRPEIGKPPHLNEDAGEIVNVFLRYDKETTDELRRKKIIL